MSRNGGDGDTLELDDKIKLWGGRDQAMNASNESRLILLF